MHRAPPASSQFLRLTTNTNTNARAQHAGAHSPSTPRRWCIRGVRVVLPIPFVHGRTVAPCRSAAGTIQAPSAVSNRNSIPPPIQASHAALRLVHGVSPTPRYWSHVRNLLSDVPAKTILLSVGTVVLGYEFRATRLLQLPRWTRLGRAVPPRFLPKASKPCSDADAAAGTTAILDQLLNTHRTVLLRSLLLHWRKMPPSSRSTSVQLRNRFQGLLRMTTILHKHSGTMSPISLSLIT